MSVSKLRQKQTRGGGSKEIKLLKSHIRKEPQCSTQNLLEGKLLQFWRESHCQRGHEPVAWPLKPHIGEQARSCRKCVVPSSDVAAGKTGRGGPPQRAESGPLPLALLPRAWPCCGLCPAAGCALLSLFLVGASPEFSLSLQVQSRQ